MTVYRRLIVITISILGIVYAFTQLRSIEEQEKELKDHYSAFPSADWIRPFLIGHEGVLADLLWLHAIDVSLEEGLVSDEYVFLHNLINFVVDLDPKFEDIAIWSTAVLDFSTGASQKEKTKAIIEILQKVWRHHLYHPTGWNHTKTYWMIPVNLGYAYSEELGQHELGAKYFGMAARIPDTPEYFKTWAATLYQKEIGKSEQSIKAMEDLLVLEILHQKKKGIVDKNMLRKIEVRLEAFYRDAAMEDMARTRISMIKKKIEENQELWEQKYVFLPLDFFLILNVQSSQLDAGIYDVYFPYLSALDEGA
ncbi:MAG: hypothetical protein KDD52_01480 [Bdellovibrionales bacterium]|nr:hypothetical protein [Bdellovibrionales bacterium]